MTDITTLSGLMTAALYHPARDDGSGIASIEILTVDNRRFRFAVEILYGECWGTGN
jgi:hypothetical protein